MERRSMTLLCLALFLLLLGMGFTAAGLYTNFWYRVDASSDTNTTVKNAFSYDLGMWRTCYTHSVPADTKPERMSGEKCVYTYQDLGFGADDKLSADDRRYKHLQRAWIAGLLVCGALQVAAILSTICGLCPKGSREPIRPAVFLISSILCLFSSIGGMASGVLFIALRDLDLNNRHIYPDSATMTYSWSFGFCWAAAGLSVLTGLLFLCLLKRDYNDVNESRKYNTFG